MNHKRFDELLYLYIYGELNKNQVREFEKHLESCPGCQREFEEFKRLSSVLDKYEYVHADEKLLGDARNDLNQLLNSDESYVTIWDRFREFINNIIPGYKLALGSAALIAIGFLAGYLILPGTKYIVPSTSTLPVEKTTGFGEPLNGSPRISNVRFIDSDDADGIIEFTFEAVMPVYMKGSPDDPEVQKVLANALISEQNPGIRLQTVNAIASKSTQDRLDYELRDALISMVRFDKNPGVRQEALQALKPYENDPKVREALFDVLAHDDSAGIRIAAINVLTSWNNEYFRGDTSLIRLLQIKLNKEKNNYIRMRSRAFLKEIQP